MKLNASNTTDIVTGTNGNVKFHTLLNATPNT